MSRFLTPLQVKEVNDTSNDGRGSWMLLAPLIYFSDLLKRPIVVEAGFVTDFASVPRVPVAFWLAGDTAHPAAVVHDNLYTTQEVDRGTADEILYEAMICTGVPTWRAWLMYRAVRAFGGSYWKDPINPQNIEPDPRL